MSGNPAFSEFADDEHRAQAEELLLELGRFAVAFERVCEGMRHAVLCILESEGLLHQRLAQVIIGDKASSELQVLLGALFAELRSRTDKADQSAVQALLKEVKNLPKIETQLYTVLGGSALTLPTPSCSQHLSDREPSRAKAPFRWSKESLPRTSRNSLSDRTCW
jgi:hypothetical protein